jgi:hypothetical protein
MLFDPSKPARTRDGREVRIYATDGLYPYVIHGAVKEDGSSWKLRRWLQDGRWSDLEDYSEDLVNIPVRIHREVWLNVYQNPEKDVLHPSADRAASGRSKDCLATVRLVIDCEEGQGLS